MGRTRRLYGLRDRKWWEGANFRRGALRGSRADGGGTMEFPGGSDNYLAITGTSHPFLTGAETFHTPSLGDEEFEIPPITLDSDPSLAVSDVVGHFEDLGEPGGPPDPNFPPPPYGVQGLEMPVGIAHGLMEQGGGLLAGGLAMDLEHTMSTQYSAAPPVTIDVPMAALSPGGLLAPGQLTTIDQSELSSQLGLSLGANGTAGNSGAPGGAPAMGTPPPAAPSPEDRLSPTPSPTGSVQEEEAEEFRRAAPAPSPPAPPAPPAPAPPAGDAPRRGKPPKKPKKKKDPNEPQKPVSAYALFFRDTQAAIKGQNPNATFGEVSKIVASMWDSLGEEQKQVYKRKTEAAKKEYLKALAAYRAILTSADPPDPDSSPTPPPAASSPAPPPPASPPEPAPGVTKLLIPKQMLAPAPAVVAVIPAAVVAPPRGPPQMVTRSVLQAAAAAAAQLPRLQPPPLQQMPPPAPAPGQASVLQAPPPLQAMQQPPAPPRPRLPAPPAPPAPPLHIQILPPLVQPLRLAPARAGTGTGSGTGTGTGTGTEAAAGGGAEPAAGAAPGEEEEEEEAAATEVVEMVAGEFGSEAESPPGLAVELVPEDPPPARCIRAGCGNAPVASGDWDEEYCSSECVVRHCRDVFLAWLASRSAGTNSVVFVK